MWDAKGGLHISEMNNHTRNVSSGCFSSCGSQIVSGSGDKTIRVWDAKMGTLMSMLEGHTLTVSSVCFSPDGCHIVSGSGDKTVKVWDAKTGLLISTLVGHSDNFIQPQRHTWWFASRRHWASSSCST